MKVYTHRNELQLIKFRIYVIEDVQYLDLHVMDGCTECTKIQNVLLKSWVIKIP